MKTELVIRIEEQLYGCEELPEGQEVLCDVLLRAEDGTERIVPYPDRLLYAHDIEEGSRICFNAKGEMLPADRE